MVFENGKLIILYGSQTGNSQDLAERIWRESKQFYFRSTVKSLDEYNILELINEKCVIFICSTTGQGEEPDNMKIFWKYLLRKSLPNDILYNLRFGVFGLGDSSYEKFNYAAKRLHKRLLQLGAQAILPLGLGDDQHDLGYDGSADVWIEQLWKELLITYPLGNGISPIKDIKIHPRWNVSLTSKHDFQKNHSIYYSTRRHEDFTAKVLANERISSPEHFQDVRLLKLKTSGQEYSPGDLIVLRPRNLNWQIEEFKEVLSSNGIDIQSNKPLSISENDSGIPVPEILKYTVTFDQLCDEYFDLMAIPRRHTFNILAQVTDSELEKEKCLEFTTAEGQNDLYTYINRAKRNIVEVLRDFPHATKNLTTDMLFEIIPPIKPREFSIASSYKAHHDEIHILLAIVKYKTKLVRERVGLCSNYLAALQNGDSITASIKHGSFKFPKNSMAPTINFFKDDNKVKENNLISNMKLEAPIDLMWQWIIFDKKDYPVIMVGPGTGVAPFRSYLFERYKENNSNPANLILFYGCRYKNKDFLCQTDFEKLHDEKKINLICAFSRDQDSKIYVQDKIRENKVLVWEAIQKNAYIFVAGSAKFMPQEVKKSFISICMQCGDMNEDEASRFLQKMEKNGRYQTECWS